MENKEKKIYVEDIDIKDFEKNKDNPEIRFQLQPYNPTYPMKASEHIFKITGQEDIAKLITYLQNKEYYNDQKLIEFIDAKAPELKDYFYKAPMLIDEFKEQIRTLFGDVPDYLFEGENYLEVLAKIINHLIKKETANFVITSINNGELDVDEQYYPIVYSSYYRVGKLNFHIPSFHLIITLWEEFLENNYWKVMFSNHETITRTELRGIIQFYNFLGNQYTEFSEILTKNSKILDEDMVWFKRTTYKTLPNYYSRVSATIKNIKLLHGEIKNQRERLLTRKQHIQELINKKSSIKKEQIDDILGGKFGIIKYKMKQWMGLNK